MSGFIGVLMLDTAFERILGDAGNPNSYHRPARTRVIELAGSTDIVRDGRPDPALVSAFCTAAKSLEAEGAVALTSTCLVPALPRSTASSRASTLILPIWKRGMRNT